MTNKGKKRLPFSKSSIRANSPGYISLAGLQSTSVAHHNISTHSLPTPNSNQSNAGLASLISGLPSPSLAVSGLNAVTLSENVVQVEGGTGAVISSLIAVANAVQGSSTMGGSSGVLESINSSTGDLRLPSISDSPSGLGASSLVASSTSDSRKRTLSSNASNVMPSVNTDEDWDREYPPLSSLRRNSDFSMVSSFSPSQSQSHLHSQRQSQSLHSLSTEGEPSSLSFQNNHRNSMPRARVSSSASTNRKRSVWSGGIDDGYGSGYTDGETRRRGLSGWERRVNHDEIRNFRSRHFKFVVQEDNEGKPLRLTSGGGLVDLCRAREDTSLIAVAGKTLLKIYKVHSPSSSVLPPRSANPPPPSPSPTRPRSPTTRTWRLAPEGSGSSSSLPSAPLTTASKKIRSTSPSPEGFGGFGLGEEAQQYNVELLCDVRGQKGMNEKIGTGYVATSIGWGFNHSNSDIVKACTNGAICVWQIRPEEVVLDQVKFEHSKTVNKVAFGGEQGHWLISGSQDGYIKLWDIREGRPSRMILNTIHDPARSFALSPMPGDVYAIASVHESGILGRWDLRKPGVCMTAVAHLGAGLCIDWGLGDGGGWVATGGMDKKIKVWNALTFETPRPLYTLKTSYPVRKVSWRPDATREIASIGIRSIFSETEGSSFASPIVEIWDVNNSSIPKYSVHSTESQASSILWSDRDTIWMTSRAESSWSQIDVVNDAVVDGENAQSVVTCWSGSGEILFAKGEFVDEKRVTKLKDESALSTITRITGRRSTFFLDAPEQIGSVILNVDLTKNIFVGLSKAYSFDASVTFKEACVRNKAAAQDVGCFEAVQFWNLLGEWFGGENTYDVALKKMMDAAKNDRVHSVVQANLGKDSGNTKERERQRQPHNRQHSLNSIELRPTRWGSTNNLTSQLSSGSGYVRTPLPLSPSSRGKDLESVVDGEETSSSDSLPSQIPKRSSGEFLPVNMLNSAHASLFMSPLTSPRGKRSRSSSRVSSKTSVTFGRRLGSTVSSLKMQGEDSESESEVGRRWSRAKKDSRHSRSRSVSNYNVGRGGVKKAGRFKEVREENSSDADDNDSTVEIRKPGMRRRTISRHFPSVVAKRMSGGKPRTSDISEQVIVHSSLGLTKTKPRRKDGIADSLKDAVMYLEEQVMASTLQRLQRFVDEDAPVGLCHAVAAVFALSRNYKTRNSLEPSWIKHLTVSYLDLLQGYGLHEVAKAVRSNCSIDAVRALRLQSDLLCSECGRRQAEPSKCKICKPTIECGICCLPILDAAIVKCEECGHNAHEACIGSLDVELTEEDLKEHVPECCEPNCSHRPCTISARYFPHLYESKDHHS